MAGLPLMQKVCTLFVASIGFASVSSFSVSAQVDLSAYGTNYIENFNSLSNSVPAGWNTYVSATVSGLGTTSTVATAGTSWTKTTGQFANYASIFSNHGTNYLGSESATIQGNCTNRALAVRQVGSGGFDPGAAFVLQLLNTTNRFNFRLNLDCMTLATNERAATWTLDYGIGANPTTFIPVATLDDPRVFGRTNLNVSFGAALNDQAGPVWIRLVALSVSTPSSGSRGTFGIDNVSLSWEPAAAITVLQPPASLDIAMIEGVAVLTWTNSAYQLQHSSQVDGVFMNLPTATSPHTNLLPGDQRFFRLVHTNALSEN